MKVRALKTFVGKTVSMAYGEVKDIEDKQVLEDLLKVKYVEEVVDDIVDEEVVETETETVSPKPSKNKKRK